MVRQIWQIWRLTMLIDVTLRKVALSDQQQAWIERRIRFALGRFVSRIRRVSVVFRDINGVRGGVDKECRLQISLLPHGEVVVADVDTSVEGAAANVSERAARTVARLLERLRQTRSERDRATSLKRLRMPSEMSVG